MINLYYAGTINGTIRLQSQLYLNRQACDYIIENKILKIWDNRSEGFGFYPIKLKYKILFQKPFKQPSATTLKIS